MTATIPSTLEALGYRAGTWTIDASHSEVGFVVRHMMVSKVRGSFEAFSGTIVTADDPTASSVSADIELNSITTKNAQRDAHIRSADFFDVENFPTMTYRSTAVRPDGGDWVIEGELTLRGVTKSVPLTLELNGFGQDAYGGYRAGFSAKAEINRRDFGVNWNAAIESGGVVVSDKVTIELEIEAVLQG
jgi:polyisoprenoid-binding protein YceI